MTTPPWGEESETGDQEGRPTSPYGQQQGYGQPYQPAANPYGASQGYGYAAPRPTNGMAIASMVVSIAGLLVCCGAPSIVGAILGHVAQKQIRERGEGGSGMALAGIIVGWIAFAIFLVIAAIYGVIIVDAINDENYDY